MSLVASVKDSLLNKSTNVLNEANISNQSKYGDLNKYFASNPGCGVFSNSNTRSFVNQVNSGLNLIMQPILAVAGVIGSVASALMNVDGILSSISDTFDSAVALVSGIADNLIEMGKEAYDSVVEAIKSIPDVIANVYNTVKDGIKAAKDAVMGALSGFSVSGTLNAGKKLVTDVYDSIKNAFKKIGSGGGNAGIGPLLAPLSCALGPVGDLFSSLVGKVTSATGVNTSGISSMVDSAGNMINTGINAATSVVDGAGNMINTATGSVSNLLSKIPNPKLNINTPFGNVNASLSGVNANANGLLGKAANQLFGTSSYSTPTSYDVCQAARSLNKFGNFDNIITILGGSNNNSYGNNYIENMVRSNTSAYKYCCCSKASMYAVNDLFTKSNRNYQQFALNRDNSVPVKDPSTGQFYYNQPNSNSYGIVNDNILNDSLSTLLENYKVLDFMDNATTEAQLDNSKLFLLNEAVAHNSNYLRDINAQTIKNNRAVQEDLEESLEITMDSYYV